MFITEQQNLMRSDSTPEALGVVNGQACSRRRAWGMPISKRLMSSVVQGGEPIGHGYRFDLPTQAYGRPVRLEWRDTDTLVAFGDDVEHLAEFGAQVGSIYLEHAIGNPVFEYEFTVPWGTQFIYQPALTPEDIAGGSEQPRAVEGSYAIYAAFGGKLGHLLRPVARSVANPLDEVWGQVTATFLRREADGDVWNVVISFLPATGINALNYPIWIDGNASMGFTSIGGSNATSGTPYLFLSGFFSTPTGGTANNMYMYMKGHASGTTLTMGFYKAADGTVGADTAALNDSNTSPHWNSPALDAPTAITAGEVYCPAWAHGANSGNYYYDTAASDLNNRVGYSTGYGAGTLPSLATVSSLAWTAGLRKYTLYVDYTATVIGGGTVRSPIGATAGLSV